MSTSRISIEESCRRPGERVVLAGHVHALRDLGGICFVNIRDASGIMQGVVEEPVPLEVARTLTAETPIRVEGVVVEQPKSSIGCELQVLSIEPLSTSNEVPPVELSKDKTIDALSPTSLFDYRPLTLRNPKVKAIFRLEAEIVRAFREFLTGQGFVEIHSPKIVATGTEGGAQLFKLDYFGQPAFLAQSPQFYKQMMVGVFERVFEVGPVYRAEEHDTSRHINEYISLDLEMGFIESELDVIAMQERLLTHLVAHINEHCQRELAIYGEGANGSSGEGIKVPSEIPKITLAEAVKLLASKYKWRPTDGGTPEEATDLDPEGERLLCEHFKNEHGSEFLYVRHYPLAVRPFYTMPVPMSATGERRGESVAGEPGGGTAIGSSQPLARGFDLLYRGLEITTGGQRIHDYNQLTEAIRGRGLEPEAFAEYLQCFKYGMPPHGGLAIGLERLAMKILGLKSVKQAALFPRDRNRLRP